MGGVSRLHRLHEGLIAWVWTTSAGVGGVAVAHDGWPLAVLMLGVATASSMWLKVLTDRRERAAFEAGARAMAEETKAAIRETFRSSDRQAA